jgi:phosphoglycerol transferase MdoB-like AlkP superfamily enzyme
MDAPLTEIAYFAKLITGIRFIFFSMYKFINFFLRTGLFWLCFFLFFRVLFIVVNSAFIDDIPYLSLLGSLFHGFRMDLSFTGYLMLFMGIVQSVWILVSGRFCYRCFGVITAFFIFLFSVVLLVDANLYRYWGSHLNIESLAFIQSPDVVLNSLNWIEVIAVVITWGVLAYLAIRFYQRIIPGNVGLTIGFPLKQRQLNGFFALFISALMIVPIRGSFGVAPINTGVAYFSQHLFANHAAINPLWNLGYSLKRIGKIAREYKFMTDDEATAIFKSLMTESGDFPNLLNTENPDIVVILLESFSAQVIEPLGGVEATPCFNDLVEEGVFFENVFAASVRSDYGLVATLTGYPGLPGYSIMQYPEKSKNLIFIPHLLKQNGYVDFNFQYGGDLGLMNMRSFINLSGFDDVVSMEDFPVNYRGEKWGVHDEYTFKRLEEMMETSTSPSFNFFFTLSSHEPFDVPMEKVFEDKYLNSVYYTDQCLGRFFESVRQRGLWENTLFVLLADHGVVGPAKAGVFDREKYHIPMLWTGGALAVTDTIVSKYASQIDLASTLLNQVGIDADKFKFSKNIFDSSIEGFSFFHFPEGYGFFDDHIRQVFDVNSGKALKMQGTQTRTDSLKARAFLQELSNDIKNK